jgi:hypothetical protein
MKRVGTEHSELVTLVPCLWKGISINSAINELIAGQSTYDLHDRSLEGIQRRPTPGTPQPQETVSMRYYIIIF